MLKVNVLEAQESYWLAKAIQAPVGSTERRESLARYYKTHEERKDYLQELTRPQALAGMFSPRGFLRKVSAGLLTRSEAMEQRRQAKR